MMKIFEGKHNIRTELVASFSAIVFISSLITYFIVLPWTRSNFDDLVKANDLEEAAAYAEILADYYERNQSWDKVAEVIGNPNPRGILLQQDSYSDESHRHPHDGDIPLIITDLLGKPVYYGLDRNDTNGEDLLKQLKPSLGEKIAIDGRTVGYVYFKSMIFRSYNPQEREFIFSLAGTLGLSVLIGLILSLILGRFLASRFADPIILLDNGVKRVAQGDMNIQLSILRQDEIGSLTKSFNLMAERLRLTEEARQNLLADIAHELRTPVSIVQANLEMILEGVYVPDEKKLKSLHKETVLMTSLIRDLRAISDLEVGITPLRPEPFMVSPFIREICEKYLPLLAERYLQLDLSLDDSVMANAEEDKIRQVLGNLLSNALKYSPENSTIKIVTELLLKEDSSREIKVIVTDEGPGVPEDSLGKIFERFYRVDHSRSRESGGRGLGLAISKTIIEMSKGNMGAHKTEPHGLSVWFTLPIL